MMLEIFDRKGFKSLNCWAKYLCSRILVTTKFHREVLQIELNILLSFITDIIIIYVFES